MCWCSSNPTNCVPLWPRPLRRSARRRRAWRGCAARAAPPRRPPGRKLMRHCKPPAPAWRGCSSWWPRGFTARRSLTRHAGRWTWQGRSSSVRKHNCRPLPMRAPRWPRPRPSWRWPKRPRWLHRPAWHKPRWWPPPMRACWCVRWSLGRSCSRARPCSAWRWPGPRSWWPRWTSDFWNSCNWASRPGWWPMPLRSSALQPACCPSRRRWMRSAVPLR